MDIWIWPQYTQCGLTWPEEGSVASDQGALYAAGEISPLASHWASTQDPPNYWGQCSGHWIQQAAVMIS